MKYTIYEKLEADRVVVVEGDSLDDGKRKWIEGDYISSDIEDEYIADVYMVEDGMGHDISKQWELTEVKL